MMNELPRDTQHLIFRFESTESADQEVDDYQQQQQQQQCTTIVVCVPLAGSQQVRLEQMPEGLCDWGASLALVDEILATYRDMLLLGGKVVELGCGAGLPSLVCAAFGATAMATDTIKALEPFKRNASATGYPQVIWEVVGNRAAGGALVQKNIGSCQERESERLSFGAIVEELERQEDWLRFKRLAGDGPSTGWVKTRHPWGQVVLTESTGPNIRAAIGNNRIGSVRSMALEWHPEAARQLLLQMNGHVDLVLCSDCVYEPLYGRCWEKLVECIEVLCGAGAAALVSVQRRKHDGFEDFLCCLSKQLVVDKVAAECTNGAEILVYTARRHSRTESFHNNLSVLNTC
mmetsp:Transcript_89732/g.172742  ORF Transcript_89732/g.172742 Transcript_89732/m.172742 type:complete len:347 (+) Transcript_89732:51-1091(+)